VRHANHDHHAFGCSDAHDRLRTAMRTDAFTDRPQNSTMAAWESNGSGHPETTTRRITGIDTAEESLFHEPMVA
jgi:hypothetical protein